MDKQKHIVIDARNRRSSTGRYTDQLVENLMEIDSENRYTVLVQPGDDWQMKNKNFSTVSCKFRQFSFNPLDQILFPLQLYKLKPDLTHFTMTQQPILFFGKTITTTHDLTMLRYTRANRFSRFMHFIGMTLYRFLLWWAHHKSKKIIVPSQFVAKDVAKYHPFARKKLVVTYEGSEVPIKGRAIAPNYVNKPFIFHVGSPFPHKNISRLIEAFCLVQKNNPDLQLVLVGKREHYFRELERWTRKQQCHDSIVFTGYVPDTQLKWLYENASAYVLPSLSEGFGLPGLEAMVYDCPVVSSNSTCLPEIYGDAARYFDPTDVNNMAATISEVLAQNSQTKKIIEKGRTQVKKYSWNKMAKETLAVYKTTS